MSTGSNVALALVSGATGGGFALMGQYFAQRSAKAIQAAELAHRAKELNASFTLPVVARRAEGLEELFELLQQAVDERAMTLSGYERIRRLLIYVPGDLSEPIVSALTRLLKGSRTGNQKEVDDSIMELRGLQTRIRKAAGLTLIDDYVTGNPINGE